MNESDRQVLVEEADPEEQQAVLNIFRWCKDNAEWKPNQDYNQIDDCSNGKGRNDLESLFQPFRVKVCAHSKLAFTVFIS